MASGFRLRKGVFALHDNPPSPRKTFVLEQISVGVMSGFASLVLVHKFGWHRFALMTMYTSGVLQAVFFFVVLIYFEVKWGKEVIS